MSDVKASKNSAYHQAGVDDELAGSLVDWLAKAGSNLPCRSNNPRQGLLDSLPSYGQIQQGVGGFASLFELDCPLTRPCIVTTTDGVGTKVLLALEHGKMAGIGGDLVAMCAGDLFTVGARPLGFLDYYATSKLDQAHFKAVLTGILSALKLCGCSLAGGETAQMPGLYQANHIDLAGFMYGVVDSTMALGAHKVVSGDLLYALPSSGFHANGYSLIRKWLAEAAEPPDADLLDRLLTPTQLYPEITYLVQTLADNTLHSCAHITGGGISGNLPRVLPAGAMAHIDLSALRVPPWMVKFIEGYGQKPWRTFENVFNLGCGMILVVDSQTKERFERPMSELGLPYYLIGEVQIHKGGEAAAQVKFHQS